MKEDELQNTLNNMTHKGLVLAIPTPNGIMYMLSPMVLGFFEFTFLRMDKPDFVNMKELSVLFDKYLDNLEVRKELYNSEPSLFRTLVYEKLIPLAVQTEVLSYEKTSEIIRQAGYWAIVALVAARPAIWVRTARRKCPSKQKPSWATWRAWQLKWAGHVRPTVDEMLQILQQAEELGLVHIADNVLNQPAVICNCCSCCCELLETIKKFGLSSTNPSNFISALDVDSCVGCGLCVDKCSIEVITMGDNGNGAEVRKVNAEICLGCGVCASACPSNTLTMSRRSSLYVPPENTAEQQLRIANSKGRC